jgi:germination protein M
MNILKKLFLLILAAFCAVAAFLFFDSLASKNTVNVYFVKDEQVLPLARKVSGKISKLNYAVEELLKGPAEKETAQGYLTEIPLATKVLNIKENPQYYIIDLSNDFQSGGGSLSMTLRLAQLTKTASETVGGKKVYLFINGKKSYYIGGEGLIVPSPLNNPQ